VSFVHRYLDPSESLLEILFGLIMALTMTAGARLLQERAEINSTELAVGLVGCNVAWGLIDAVFYLLGTQFNRNRRVRFVRRCRPLRTRQRRSRSSTTNSDSKASHRRANRTGSHSISRC
jgi:hypothetical protein